MSSEFDLLFHVKVKSFKAQSSARAGFLPELSAETYPQVSVCLNVGFRFCERDDLRRLEWEGIFRQDRNIIRSVFRRQERGTQIMLLAETDGMPVGQVWIDLIRKRKEEAALLWAIRVVPWLQRRGIGTQLLQIAEQLARSHGCGRAELTVEKRNTAARRFYEQSGYSVVGDCEDYENYTTNTGRRVRLRRYQFVMSKVLGEGRSERPLAQGTSPNHSGKNSSAP
ncbi:MAG TPA: GNAT family N-acetyltransferase [Clostridia bacterium]|nr:GNAT family N-acetyltransferase [Clostridia bacterium]